MPKVTPLKCREYCPYPGFPCGFKANTGGEPCVDIMLALRKMLAIQAKVTYSEVILQYAGSISSNIDGNPYVTSVYANTLLLGKMIEGSFTSD